MNRALIAIGLFALAVTAGLAYLGASLPPPEPSPGPESFPERTVAYLEVDDLARLGPPPAGAVSALRRELGRAAATVLVGHGIPPASLAGLPARRVAVALVPDPGSGRDRLGLVAVFETPDPAGFARALQERALAGFRPPPGLHLQIRGGRYTVTVALAPGPIEGLLAPRVRHRRSLADQPAYRRARQRLEPVAPLVVWLEVRPDVVRALGLDLARAGASGAAFLALTAALGETPSDRSVVENK